MNKPQPHPTRFHGERARWLVQSNSQPGVPVFVDMDEYDGNGWCACEDFQFRKQPQLEASVRASDGTLQCRHIKAVLAEIERQKNEKTP